MHSPRKVTFRAALIGVISDFLTEASMEEPRLADALTSTAIAIADWREEGVQLFPRLLICRSQEQTLKVVQGSDAITLGEDELSSKSAKLALKNTAPLAINGWAAWMECANGRLRYGVFREKLMPTSIDLRQTILAGNPAEGSAILLSQFGPGQVELIATGHTGVRAHLTEEREDKVTGDHQEVLVNLWVRDLDASEEVIVNTKAYLSALLRDILRKGHGALIAVAAADVDTSEQIAGDALLLDDPIDFPRLLQRHEENQQSSRLAELLDYTQLLAGMLGSDGIVLFDSRGRVLGFHWFIKSQRGNDAAVVHGGARHRAFADLTALALKGDLLGAFIRSSDGGENSYRRESMND